MSNVSPQLNVAVASSVRRSREQCGVAHQTVTRAGDAPKCGEPSAHVVEAPSKGHGAEAPRKSNSRLSRFVQSRVGERSGRARQLCHLTRRRIKCRVSHCRRRWSTLEERAMRRNTKCRNDRGSARVTFRMQASQRPTSSPREPSRLPVRVKVVVASFMQPSAEYRCRPNTP